jgi:hypothetical protein
VTESERDERMLAEEPLDDLDAAMLSELRALYDVGDPVPDDLVERVRFSLALDEVFDEVARMTRVPLDELAVRGDAPIRTETLTFSADRLTAMVTVTPSGGGRLRLDGWLAPPAPMRVGLRRQDAQERETLADEDGRFSFEDLDPGFGQLSFRPADGAEPGESTVVTPLFQL